MNYHLSSWLLLKPVNIVWLILVDNIWPCIVINKKTYLLEGREELHWDFQNASLIQ